MLYRFLILCYFQKRLLVRPESIIIREALVLPPTPLQLCSPTYSALWFPVENQLLVETNSLFKGREGLGHPQPSSETLEKVLLPAAEESTRKTIEFQK